MTKPRKDNRAIIEIRDGKITLIQLPENTILEIIEYQENKIIDILEFSHNGKVGTLYQEE